MSKTKNVIPTRDLLTKTKTRKTVSIQLPVSSNHGIPILADFLNEIQRMYDIEKNIKCNLYAFISSKGLNDELKQYSLTYDMTSHEGHTRDVESMMQSALSELKKVKQVSES